MADCYGYCYEPSGSINDGDCVAISFSRKTAASSLVIKIVTKDEINVGLTATATVLLQLLK